MKKIFKKIFSIDRIDLISKYFKIKDSKILEVGVHKGDFSKKLIKNFSPKKLILVDPWVAFEDNIYKDSLYGKSEKNGQQIQDQYFNDLTEYFQQDISYNKVEIVRNTSDKFFLTNNSKFDLIYIDGNHLYDFVKKDLLNSLNCLNQNGIIILDDYKRSGWWKNGVTKAVDFLEKQQEILILDKHNFFNHHYQCIVTKV
jgi:hypothetical protein|tara:strand:+ start:1346 stop:1942 length:597 start_codon:yes stop_codon:yes gene_type:complete